jgi:hypothetical protein
LKDFINTNFKKHMKCAHVRIIYTNHVSSKHKQIAIYCPVLETIIIFYKNNNKINSENK